MTHESRTGVVHPETFGPWALITGASSGIGAEFARQLASCGLRLVLAARRQSELEALAGELEREQGVECRVVPVDLSRPHAVAALEHATQDLDVGLVVSNAGSGFPGEFLRASREELHAIVHLNAVATLDLAHAFGRRLAARGRGGLLLVGALGGSEGIPLMANAGATKAFVHSLGEALHLELGVHGVTVTVLIPGPTDTPVLEKFGIERLPMKPVAVDQCVSEALSALVDRRAHVVPGRLVRLMKRIAPASLVRRMTMTMFARGIATKERHALDGR